MLAVRAVLHGLLFASLVSLNHEDVKTDPDCDFLSCFDCRSVKCTWLTYFDGRENCAQSSRGIPGVEDVIVTPRQCKKPACVKPNENSDIIGLAQWLGGAFGGLVLGLCGGATCLKWDRRQLREYERLEGGRRTWRDLAMTFYRAILRQFIREVDVEGPLLADDEDGNEPRQQGGINRVNQQREENARLEQQQRHRNLGVGNRLAGENPQLVASARVANPVDVNQAADVAVVDVGNIVAHPLLVGVEDLGQDGVENLQEVVVPQVPGGIGQQVGVAIGQQVGEEREDHEVAAASPARVSPLVQQARVIRQSLRQASRDAKARMTNMKLNRLT